MNGLKLWWHKVPKEEKPGVITLVSIIGIVLLFSAGMALGRLFGQFL